MRWRRVAAFEPYVPKVHYGTLQSICRIENSGSKNRKLSTNIKEVTCKLCLKKHKKGKWVTEHFEDEDLFTI